MASEGRDTSEFQVARSAELWSAVALVFGIVMTAGSAVAESLGADTTAGIVVGAVVSVVAIAQRTLVALGYMSGRASVKASSGTTEGPPSSD
jgi:hypothetical protein